MVVEPPLKYGPCGAPALTRVLRGPRLAGSLTGVVASKSVTEAPKGALRPIGNRPSSVMAQGRLTARPTGRAGRKLGHSDPKGWAVRPLKWHASWVQNVVRQFGLYLSRALEI